MRVGVILHPFGNSSRGLEQFVLESTCAMLQNADAGTQFTVFVKGHPDVSALPAGTHVVNLPSHQFWKWSLLSWSSKIDTFIFYTETAPLFLWKKSIIFFLDAAYVYFHEPGLQASITRKFLIWWRSHMMQRANHVVALSYASKKDLLETFSVADDHITVIYPGFKALEMASDMVPVTNPYFMYVGPVKERKNVYRIIEAYDLFRNQTNLSHDLYLVGRPSTGEYEEKVQKRITSSEYKNSIIFKTSVDDAELSRLYQGATALVFPSLLEGFGLPVLEALSVGCMVITSSTTSTKEALGEAGFLVDPEHVDQIAHAMRSVAHGDYDKEEFKRSAALQCEKFSWQKTAEEWGELLK